MKNNVQEIISDIELQKAVKKIQHDYFLYKKPVIDNSDNNDVVNHNDFEIEYFHGEPCIRLYCTVASSQNIRDTQHIGPNQLGRSEYKDVQMDSNGSILFSGPINQGFWVNAGRPLRALAWFAKYKRQDQNFNPKVRSWLMNIKDYYELVSDVKVAPSFSQLNYLEKIKDVKVAPSSTKDVINIDQNVPNQFLITHNMMEKLISSAIPHTLITYTEHPNTSECDVNILREKCGVPLQNLKTFDIFINQSITFNKYPLREAQHLSILYDIWTEVLLGQSGWLDKNLDLITKSPAEKKRLMKTYGKIFNHKASKEELQRERLQTLKHFLAQEKVDASDLTSPEVSQFMNKVVVPWANIAKSLSHEANLINSRRFKARRGLVL